MDARYTDTAHTGTHIYASLASDRDLNKEQASDKGNMLHERVLESATFEEPKQLHHRLIGRLIMNSYGFVIRVSFKLYLA